MQIRLPPLAGCSTKSTRFCQHRRAEQGRIDVAEDHHVVAEEILLADREPLQAAGVRLGVLLVGVLEHALQVDGRVAGEHVAQVAELVAGISLDQEHVDLFLAQAPRDVPCGLPAPGGRRPPAPSPAIGSISTLKWNSPSSSGR